MMTVFWITVLSALGAWLFLLGARGGFWRADQRLKPQHGRGSWPGVVAVIPARNEADVIGRVVGAHMAMNYPGPYRVILVDDRSDDGTARIAGAAAAGGPHDLVLTTAPPLEEGWTGKLWALHHGLGLTEKVMPDARYVLLTDADILYEPDMLQRMVAKAQAEDLSLVSLMALLDARGVWGGLLIPAFIFFFQKLYPFSWVNAPAKSTAGAAGGSMLIRADALKEVGGVAPIRGALIDDCALARLVKGNPPKRGIWLGLTRSVVSLRDNRSLESIWNMVARTAYTQLHYSPFLLAGSLLGMAVLYLAGPLAVLTWPLHGQAGLAALGGAVWLLMSVAYVPTVRFYRRPVWQALALPLAAGLYGAMTLASGVRHWRGGGARWKGRRYQAAGS